MKGGPEQAMENFRRHGLRIYGTFIFGYDHDTVDTFTTAVEFAKSQAMFIAAFNHITPFPGTPLYDRMAAEGRLTYEPWWLDDRYRYNMIPFEPATMPADELAARCLEARRDFYSWSSIAKRARHPVHRRDPWMLANFVAINAMHQADIEGRNGLPLGDANWSRSIIEATNGTVLPPDREPAVRQPLAVTAMSAAPGSPGTVGRGASPRAER
jgi:hypothetical protein